MLTPRRSFLASLLALPVVGRLLGPESAASAESFAIIDDSAMPELYAMSWDSFYLYDAKTPDWLAMDPAEWERIHPLEHAAKGGRSSKRERRMLRGSPC